VPVSTRVSLADQLRMSSAPIFGFEFFPPKDDQGVARLTRTVQHLESLAPDFVSVTYGANGSSRQRTIAATERLRETSIRTVAHLTCASQAVSELNATLDQYTAVGVDHVLAIRGDMPGGPTAPWQQHPNGLANATELVRLVKSHGDYCVGVAAFPDPHPEHRDPDLDARLLLDKVEAGAEFAISQLFFDPDSYFDLVERVRDLGCQVPIIPGIMPLTSLNQIQRFTELSGAALPAQVVERLRAAGDDAERVRHIGSRIASELAVTLLRGGAPGLQFFTQNRSTATREIFSMLLERRW